MTRVHIIKLKVSLKRANLFPKSYYLNSYNSLIKRMNNSFNYLFSFSKTRTNFEKLIFLLTKFHWKVGLIVFHDNFIQIPYFDFSVLGPKNSEFRIVYELVNSINFFPISHQTTSSGVVSNLTDMCFFTTLTLLSFCINEHFIIIINTYT